MSFFVIFYRPKVTWQFFSNFTTQKFCSNKCFAWGLVSWAGPFTVVRIKLNSFCVNGYHKGAQKAAFNCALFIILRFCCCYWRKMAALVLLRVRHVWTRQSYTLRECPVYIQSNTHTLTIIIIRKFQKIYQYFSTKITYFSQWIHNFQLAKAHLVTN